jgi:hypothetical protein
MLVVVVGERGERANQTLANHLVVFGAFTYYETAIPLSTSHFTA